MGYEMCRFYEAVIIGSNFMPHNTENIVNKVSLYNTSMSTILRHVHGS